jgi:hypothetical protein
MDTAAIATTTAATNETAAHIAAAKAKLALAAAKQAAKNAVDILTAEKEALKQAATERATLIEKSKAEIAAFNVAHATYIEQLNIEHASKIAAFLMKNGLNVDDITSKRKASAVPETREYPAAWVKGAGIDANGFVVDSDSEASIYRIGQKGRVPLALTAALDAALSRQNSGV